MELFDKKKLQMFQERKTFLDWKEDIFIESPKYNEIRRRRISTDWLSIYRIFPKI